MYKLSNYAITLIERKAAIDGKVKRKVAIIGASKTLTRVNAYGNALITKGERVKIESKNGVDRFNCVIKRQTDAQADQERLTKVDKRTFKQFEVWVRNAYSGTSKIVRARAMDYVNACKQVAKACGLHERIIERELIRR